MLLPCTTLTTTLACRSTATNNTELHTTCSRRNGTSRFLRYCGGGITGDLEFLLQKRRSFGATCTQAGVVLRLGLMQYRQMMEDTPKLAVLLQHMILHNEMHSASAQLSMIQRRKDM
jgi:CRP-like cAMP-binding protein